MLAERYVGGHPMAGSERSGPLAASTALFDGRPWAVTRTPDRARRRWRWSRRSRGLAARPPVAAAPDEHDRAVARTSHLPHLLAVPGRRPAGRSARRPTSPCPVRASATSPGSPEATPRCGSRSSPPTPPPLLAVCSARCASELDALRRCRDARATARSARCSPAASPAPGHPGQARRPGRGRPVGLRVVPDHPGELARLFADAGASGVNIEDVRMDHDPGASRSLELVVAQGSARTWLLAGGAWLGDPRLRVAADWSGVGVTRRLARWCWVTATRTSQFPTAAVGPAKPVRGGRRCFPRVTSARWSSPSTARRAPASPAPSRGVARRLGLRYLDTGAMYRALTWWLLRRASTSMTPRRPPSASSRRRDPVGTDPRRPGVIVDGVDVTDRDPHREVTAAVSAGQRVPAVRARARPAPAQPDRATTASSSRAATSARSCPRRRRSSCSSPPTEAARAAQRGREERGADARPAALPARARDPLDSGRPASPLLQADDALVVDSTTYSLDEVVDLVVARVAELGRRRRDRDETGCPDLRDRLRLPLLSVLRSRRSGCTRPMLITAFACTSGDGRSADRGAGAPRRQPQSAGWTGRWCHRDAATGAASRRTRCSSARWATSCI